MRAILALARVDWLVKLSYRFQTLMSIASLVVMVIPLYFVAGAVQPIMGGVIQNEGGEAFGFLLVGLATLSLVSVLISGLPAVLGAGIRTGTLEALLSTPVPMWRLLAGLMTFRFGWAALRAVISLVLGWGLGMSLVGEGLIPALLVLALTLVAHVPLALMGAAMVFAFRTAEPIPRLFVLSTTLFGGVYYPTSVIPPSLAGLADLLPMTYGLRALRRTLLQGAGLGDVSGDLIILSAITVVTMALGLLVFRVSLAYARRNGTLAQY